MAYTVCGAVNPVAVRACKASLLVGTALPVQAAIVLVAIEAHAVLQPGRSLAADTKVQHVLADFAVSEDLFAVFVNRAVTGFALQASRQGCIASGGERRTGV